jgi:hypothetical protein
MRLDHFEFRVIRVQVRSGFESSDIGYSRVSGRVGFFFVMFYFGSGRVGLQVIRF